MKKLIFTLIVSLCFLDTSLFSQAVEKGNILFNVGVGVGGRTGTVYLGTGSATPALSATLEFASIPIGETGIIGIGAIGGFKRYSYTYFTSKYNYNRIGFGPRATFHLSFIPVEKLDVYGIVQLLFTVDTGDSITSSNLITNPNVIVGGRYFLTDNIAGFVEVGYSFSWATAGIAFKF